VSFTLVTASGDRHKVPTEDHIFFAPNVDDDGSPLPDEERSPIFTAFARGSRVRHLFFDLITAIETEGTLGTKEPGR